MSNTQPINVPTTPKRKIPKYRQLINLLIPHSSLVMVDIGHKCTFIDEDEFCRIHPISNQEKIARTMDALLKGHKVIICLKFKGGKDGRLWEVTNSRCEITHEYCISMNRSAVKVSGYLLRYNQILLSGKVYEQFGIV